MPAGRCSHGEWWHCTGRRCPSDLIWCTADTGWSKAETSILFGPWSCGSAVLFYNGRFDPKRRFELQAKYHVTVFCAAATELRQLVLQDVRPYDLSALRLVMSAGETVNPEIIERWRNLIGVPLLDGYGLTETLMNVLNYPGMPVKPGSMGRPLPGTEIAVLDAENRPVPVGQPGCLMIRLPNPQAMLGYWNDPALTNAAIVRRDGSEWFNSGDIVKVDQDGYVFYLGRSDDVINSAGYRIGPVEVENAVIEHMAVQECAVVASPDAERGEIVKAFVVLRPGIAGSDLLGKDIQEHVKRITAPYKYPRKIEFVDELPKTASGKIQRRVLRDREYAKTSQTMAP
jgi:acyl-coenzyme A synthetase/AMP-(fatty) acid ligase